MIIYNQAFDLYHAIFRILHFLNHFQENDIIEVDRLRIWDFYLLFPNKINDIRPRQNDSEIRRIKKAYIKDSNNPYEIITDDRKIFERVKPYQLNALNCIASYGIVDKESLREQRILIINKKILNDFVSKINELSPKESNIISLMALYFYDMSLYGANGLKNRTNLMESKYDAE
jgi:hypothetical protein